MVSKWKYIMGGAILLLVGSGLVAARYYGRAAAKDDIREAVFRHQFDYLGPLENADYYFISSTSEEFLARFEGHAPTVSPETKAVRSPEGVSHIERGGRGLSFWIGEITWIDRNTVDVHGGYYQASLSSSDNTYRVEREDGKWAVTKNTVLGIS